MHSKILLTSALVLLTNIVTAVPVADPIDIFHDDEFAVETSKTFLSRLLRRDHTQHCSSGVRVWGVRGTNSTRGENPMAAFAHQLAQAIPGSFGSDLPYPAATNSDMTIYEASVLQGQQMLTDRISKYVERCPGHKIAILGFSQGAQVVANTLIGNGQANNPTSGLAPNLREAIAAVATFGDPTFVPGIAPNDAGSATTMGVCNRQNGQEYLAMGYANILRIYCAAGDRWCAGNTGADAFTIHDLEPQTYGNEALSWMESTIRAALGA